jgi:hypothetical protein
MLNMIETFFFISLAVTFVLILLLVYHFKQRFTSLEQKTETMFEIVNNVVSEITTIRRQIYVQAEHLNVPGSDGMNLADPNIQYNISDKLIVSDSDDSDDSDDDSDDDSNDDSNDDSDDDSDDEDGDDKNKMDGSSVKIVTVDVDNMKLDEINIIEPMNEEGYSSNEDMDVPVVNINIEPIVVDKIELVEDYNKMTLTSLRKLIVSLELNNDPSKLKKTELIEILERR